MIIDIERLKAAIDSGQSVLLAGRAIRTIEELEREVKAIEADHEPPAALAPTMEADVEARAEARAEELYQKRIAALLEAAPPLQLNGLMAKTVAQLREECQAAGIDPGERTKADLVELLAGAAFAATRTAWVVRRNGEGVDGFWTGVDVDLDIQEAILLHDQRSAERVAESIGDGAEAVEIPVRPSGD